MFQEKAVMFMYCISPVHAGAGTALGTIDSPIQRERHTYHPTMAGSGIKGALLDHCEGLARAKMHVAATETDKSGAQKFAESIRAVFGPEPDKSNDYAGAVSFSDAQIVLFPVRSLKSSFVYVTCPTALARLQRLLQIAGVSAAGEWKIPDPGELKYISMGALSDERLVLESFEFQRASGMEGAVARFIAENALPDGPGGWAQFFREKVQQDIILLSDSDFTHFVRHSTLVEPHVRISDESGTAEDGGLFYVENLPPETLLASLVMASVERTPKEPRLSASEVMEFVRKNLGGQLVQIGGDSTTGRGQMFLAVSR